jgi:hypothetical protein
MTSLDRDANDPGASPQPAGAPAKETEGEPAGRRNRWAWLAAILALIVIVLLGYVIYRFMTDEPISPPTAQVSVPDFVGRSLDDARVIAAAVGLELVPRGQASDQPISTILMQDPRSGTMVEQGSSVAVTIATGTGAVRVPDLRGLPEATAVGLLSQAGLTAGVRTEAFDPVVAAGSVAGQQPQAGTEVSRRTPVAYVVSRGPASSPSGGPSPSLTPHPTQTAAPTGGSLAIGDYRCLTLTAATTRLQSDGFALGSVVFTFPGGPVDATWLVETQAPAAGVNRPVGTAVSLTLSSPLFVCLEQRPSVSPSLTPHPTQTAAPTGGSLAIGDYRCL